MLKELILTGFFFSFIFLFVLFAAGFSMFCWTMGTPPFATNTIPLTISTYLPRAHIHTPIISLCAATWTYQFSSLSKRNFCNSIKYELTATVKQRQQWKNNGKRRAMHRMLIRRSKLVVFYNITYMWHPAGALLQYPNGMMELY